MQPVRGLGPQSRKFGVVMARVAPRPLGGKRVEVLLQYDYDAYQWIFPAAPAEAGDSDKDAGNARMA